MRACHETKDILFVQRGLGHGSLKNTLRCIQLAEKIEQSIPLIEAGYVEAADFKGVKIFKMLKSRARAGGGDRTPIY